jgi:hypothetical protein
VEALKIARIYTLESLTVSAAYFYAKRPGRMTFKLAAKSAFDVEDTKNRSPGFTKT